MTDLQVIEDYILQDNPDAAFKTIKRILKAIDHLKSHPNMGRVGRKTSTRELVVATTPFLVIYQIREQVIIIMRVMHGARQWP